MWVSCQSVSCATWETSRHPSSLPVSTLPYILLSHCSSRSCSSQQVGNVWHFDIFMITMGRNLYLATIMVCSWTSVVFFADSNSRFCRLLLTIYQMMSLFFTLTCYLQFARPLIGNLYITVTILSHSFLIDCQSGSMKLQHLTVELIAFVLLKPAVGCNVGKMHLLYQSKKSWDALGSILQKCEVQLMG